MIKLIKKAKKVNITIACISLLVLFCLADIATGEYIDFSVIYFLPIAVSAWFVGKRIGAMVVIISTVCWLYSEWSIGTRYQETHSFVINGLLMFGGFLLLVVLIDRLKKEIKLSAEHKILREKEETIIKTSQNICGLIGQHVAFHNSEIINWINTKKNSGHQVSEKVEKSSQAIGKNIAVLTNMSFGSIYDQSKKFEADKFLLDLKDKLKSVEENINNKDNKNNKLN